MKVVEIKVIYESDDIEKATKEISDIFYDFGVTGLKIEEPLSHKNQQYILYHLFLKIALEIFLIWHFFFFQNTDSMENKLI